MGRNAEAVRRHLFSLSARGIKYDLDRMYSAAEACGNPQNACPCFHVAGTNGKGSVCAYIESCLRHCGFTTGLFTSPHLVRFEERFMVNGRPVGEQVWLNAYSLLQNVIDRFRLTFFEASALMAFEIFRRERVEWTVFETGLGGRLDATNVVIPVVSVIARVAMDHCEYLGDDIYSILSEKLGIVKKNVPLVMADPGCEKMKKQSLRGCEEMKTSCTFVATHATAGSSNGADGTMFRFDGKDYRIHQAGAYQVDNAMLALSALRAAGLSGKCHEGIARGIAEVRLPGRFQEISLKGKLLLFDVGHNPDAADAFCRSLRERYKSKSICFVLGIMKDKDIRGITACYASVARRIICTAPATERAAVPESIRNLVPESFTGVVSVALTVELAIEEAFKAQEDIVCIAGSFFTVGEAMAYLHIDPYPYGDRKV